MANYSLVLTTTPAKIVPAAMTPRTYLRITNVNISGGASAWVSHMVTNPAANTAGSVEIVAGTANGEEYSSAPGGSRSYVPQGEVWGVAASGTVQLTVEAN